MTFRRKNRFDVQVVFPHHAFGIQNLKEHEMERPLTPAIVADELEEFCRRVRKVIAAQKSKSAGARMRNEDC